LSGFKEREKRKSSVGGRKFPLGTGAKKLRSKKERLVHTKEGELLGPKERSEGLH